MIEQNFVRLPLNNITNCRDLGGYGTEDAKATKWHTLLRSSNLLYADKSDMKFLKEYGLTHVIDLRSTEEVENEPNPFMNKDGVKYNHINLLKVDSIRNLGKENLDLETIYVGILENKVELKQVFDIILNNSSGATLYHCSAGKDRTGVISMLALGLVGVGLQDIMTNYEVSFTNIASDLKTANIDRLPMNLTISEPEIIKNTFEYILKEYQTIEKYFESLGYTNVEIKQLKETIAD